MKFEATQCRRRLSTIFFTIVAVGLAALITERRATIRRGRTSRRRIYMYEAKCPILAKKLHNVATGCRQFSLLLYGRPIFPQNDRNARGPSSFRELPIISFHVRDHR